MMRKRSRVRLEPVVFVIVRRTEMVPKVELVAGELVKSRPMFGDWLSPCATSKTREDDP